MLGNSLSITFNNMAADIATIVLQVQSGELPELQTALSSFTEVAKAFEDNGSNAESDQANALQTAGVTLSAELAKHGCTMEDLEGLHDRLAEEDAELSEGELQLVSGGGWGFKMWAAKQVWNLGRANRWW